MFDIVRKDISRYRTKVKRSRLSILYVFQQYVFAFGLQAVLIYRFGQWIRRSLDHPAYAPIQFFLLFIYKILALTVKKLYGIQLSDSAEIGPGLKIGHFSGICVQNCTIGENCSIQQHVKIGRETNQNEKWPKIGSYVWIGSHSKIVANVTIADHATIGAGSNVKTDVATKCLALGSPARIIKKDYDNSNILNAEF